MKLVGVREAQAALSGLVEQSQTEKVILTRHGKPVAVLTGVEGQDLEEVMLTQDPGFAKLMEERRKPGPLISHEDVRAMIEGKHIGEEEPPVEKIGARAQPKKAATPRRRKASGG